MANQLIIKGLVKVSQDIISTNVQNTAYTLPTSVGTEGQVLKVVGGIPTWSSSGSDNDGIAGPFTYNYDQTSPVTIFTAPSGTMITDVSVEIITPFSDSLAALIVGDSVNSDILMSANQVDLAAPAGQIFQVSPGKVYQTGTAILLTIDPQSSTVGTFKITLSYMQ